MRHSLTEQWYQIRKKCPARKCPVCLLTSPWTPSKLGLWLLHLLFQSCGPKQKFNKYKPKCFLNKAKDETFWCSLKSPLFVPSHFLIYPWSISTYEPEWASWNVNHCFYQWIPIQLQTKLYSFLRTATSKCQKLGDLKQQKFIASQFWKWEVWNQGISKAMFSMMGLGENHSLTLLAFVVCQYNFTFLDLLMYQSSHMTAFLCGFTLSFLQTIVSC